MKLKVTVNGISYDIELYVEAQEPPALARAVTRTCGGKTSAIETAQSKPAIQLPVPEKTLDFDFGL